ncbi:cytochrome c biogenesis protein CcsA [Methylonatrum kenyense]|uniref:cytochrome C assembly family protein n=1 Tax=Methylonatrum kenyense TaxID=455253 RepID=UPI0020BDDE1E|nr:cytochrome c biogenesis protein CcsA [Methylonatrum kenyense]MCK8517239.1 cytochrome c biogenesis protein CcsA [Methylonatrum kenyense]
MIRRLLGSPDDSIPSMEHVTLIILAIVLYLCASGAFSLRLARQGDSPPAARTAALGMGLLAIAVHAVVLWGQTVLPQGLNLGFFTAGSLVTWLMAALILIAALRKPVENLAVVILPISAVALILSTVFAPAAPTGGNVPLGLEAHILSSILAYSLLSIAALQALVLAYQDHHLHNRHPEGLIRLLPPLRVMETLLFQMLWLGFGLLTLSLVTGAIFLEDIFGQHLVHKTTLSIAAWLVFAILLFGRWRYGWRGRTAIRWTLGGFIALMLAYFGTKLVLELILFR